MVLDFFIVSLCVVMVVQDIKDRMISLILFPVLAAFVIWRSLLFWGSFMSAIIVWRLSFLFLLLILIVISGYAFIKGKGFFEMIGVGDVLFMAIGAIFFPLVSYVVYLVFSFVFGYVFGFIMKGKSIPLVAVMALFLVGLIVASYTFDSGRFSGTMIAKLLLS